MKKRREREERGSQKSGRSIINNDAAEADQRGLIIISDSQRNSVARLGCENKWTDRQTDRRTAASAAAAAAGE